MLTFNMVMNIIFFCAANFTKYNKQLLKTTKLMAPSELKGPTFHSNDWKIRTFILKKELIKISKYTLTYIADTSHSQNNILGNIHCKYIRGDNGTHTIVSTELI